MTPDGGVPYRERVITFSSIRIGDVMITGRRISGRIGLEYGDGRKEEFNLLFTYSSDVDIDLNTAGLMLTMPAINFTYFSRRLILDFPVSGLDRELISGLVETNAREVFINKICRRRYEFFREEFLPGEDDITEENAKGMTEIVTPVMGESAKRHEGGGRPLVLSSGGKESLLTFGMLHEGGNNPHAFYFNESGGHWKTAVTAYRSFRKRFGQVSKVWSNNDRFYAFMLRRIKILDQAAIRKIADTYPLQLFIFPVYVFASLPVMFREGLSSIVMGNEFDDPREILPFRGMHHYYGVYDQSQDFMQLMTSYFAGKGYGISLWSAVYPVTGLIVEKVLVNRYHDLFLQQRSCHSCRYADGKIMPCGECTKCLGVMMFIRAAGGNPGEVLYSPAAISTLRDRVESARMRLDSDELSHVQNMLWAVNPGSGREHVEAIHIIPGEAEPMSMIPPEYRELIRRIIRPYCTGIFRLEGQLWEQA